jgi:putative endonuclease
MIAAILSRQQANLNMNISNQQIGKMAELKAKSFLEAKGYRLIVQNYSCYCGEIDLIMQDQEDIVFVEVRSRKHTRYGNALESIHPGKVHKLIKTATYFLQARKWLHRKNSRFDVIAIHPGNKEMSFEWFKNAFTVDKYW